MNPCPPLKCLESESGAFYIEDQNLCPLTHVAHRVGQNLKLCVPIVKQGKCSVPKARKVKRQHRK